MLLSSPVEQRHLVPILQNKTLFISVKRRVNHAIVLSTLLYGAETLAPISSTLSIDDWMENVFLCLPPKHVSSGRALTIFDLLDRERRLNTGGWGKCCPSSESASLKPVCCLLPWVQSWLKGVVPWPCNAPWTRLQIEDLMDGCVDNCWRIRFSELLNLARWSAQ